MRILIKKLFLLTACSCMYCLAGAQTVTHSSDTSHKVNQPMVKPKGPKAIAREWSMGFRINSNGWGIYSDLGRIKARDMKHSDMFYNIRFWQFELDEKKDPKEYKTSGQGSNGRNYIFGKINNFYAFKIGRGYAKMIAGKPDPGSVSIHWVYAGGFSLGLLKPYYLHVQGDPNAIRYTEENKENFLDSRIIEGSAGFGKGLNEIQVVPGAHLKTAIHFDFSANRKNVIGVETGINFEYYSQDVQILARQSPTPYFADLFIGVQFGKRW